MHPSSIRSAALAAALAVTGLVATVPAEAAVLFNYPSFTSTSCGTSLTCVGSTAVSGSVLRLTPNVGGQAGAGYSTTAVSLGAGATFSTTFQFQITNPAGIDPADGLVFVVSAGSSGLGGSGGGIGYQGVPNSVGIEFDTYNNGGSDNNSSNEVGVDINGNLTSAIQANPYGVVTCDFGSATPYTAAGCLANGDIWSVTIGYDGTNLTVQVKDGSAATQTIINAYPINLASILGTTSAFVGFTSGTGSGAENHDILNWALANDTTLAVPPTPGVPEPLTVGLFGIGLAGLAAARRGRR